MKKCPCEECISFAICYNIDQIKCEALYRFVSRTSSFIQSGVKKEIYVAPILDTDEIIYQVYNRFLEGTTITHYKVILTNDINMTRKRFKRGTDEMIKKLTPKKLKGIFSHDQ